MSRQVAVSALVAFLIAGGAGWLVSSNSGSNETVATSTLIPATTEPPTAYFIRADETVIGPAAVVITDLQLEGEQAVLEFELERLAPVGDAASVTQLLSFQSVEEVPAAELETVFLDDWTLSTASGDVPGSVAAPSARSVRFHVGAGFSMDSVTGATLESYGLLVPVDTEIELDVDREAATVAPGVTARLLAVTEQATTIVQVEVMSSRDFNYDGLAVAGIGPGWKSAVREAEGRPRWNLTYDSPAAPTPIALRVHGAVWITMESAVDVALEIDP